MSGQQNSNKPYYGVREGRNPGVYDNWNDARQQVEGHSGNVHKGFDTYQQAQDFSRGQPSGGSSRDNYGVRGPNMSGVTNDYGKAASETYGRSGATMKNFPNNPDGAWQYAQGGNQGGSQGGSNQQGNYGRGGYY